MMEQRQESEWILSCLGGVEVIVGMHQRSERSTFPFTVVVDVVTEFGREGASK